MRNPHATPPDPRKRGVPCPPADPRPHVRHLLAPTAGLVRVVALDSVVYGSETHFVDGRSQYCPGEDNGCAWCLLGKRQHWQGWLPVVVEFSKQARLLVIPMACYANSPTLKQQDGRLLHQVLEVGRLAEHKSGPVRCRVLGPTTQQGLPPCPALLPALERLWRLPVGTIWRGEEEGDAPAVLPIG